MSYLFKTKFLSTASIFARLQLKILKAGYRCFHLTPLDTHVEIKIADEKNPLKFHYVWLRDHCRCSMCYSHELSQSFSNVQDIPLDIKPRQCEIADNNLKIMWKDAHESVYSLKWLQNLNQPVPSNKGVILWNANNVASFNDVKISMNDFLKNEDGLRYLLTSLHKYGFGFVTGVEPTLEATEKIATRVSLVKNTFFGDTWHITDYEDKPYADVSYTKKSLSCHTDNTYFSDASGLLVFHILAKDGFGGKTILVDGFKVADTLKEANVSQYELLCNTVMGSHFVDKMFRFYNMDPVIKLHPILKEPLQIRYNTFDRAPLTSLTHENVLSFYEAYQSFGKITNASKSELRLSLSPGTVLFIDNWRVLHGRTAYDGKRVLGGCFLTHDDWRSRARTIGLNCL